MLVLRVCLPLARYLPGLWQPRRWAESVAESSLQAGRGCGFPALSLPPVKEGSVLCSKCSKRFLSSQWRLQSFFSHCSARNPLGPFLPRVTKISIPDGLIAHRSYGRNATGRKSLIVARNVARHGTARGHPKNHPRSVATEFPFHHCPPGARTEEDPVGLRPGRRGGLTADVPAARPRSPDAAAGAGSTPPPPRQTGSSGRFCPPGVAAGRVDRQSVAPCASARQPHIEITKAVIEFASYYELSSQTPLQPSLLFAALDKTARQVASVVRDAANWRNRLRALASPQRDGVSEKLWTCPGFVER